jgi:hypothetical protein
MQRRKEGERRLGCIDGVRMIAPARAPSSGPVCFFFLSRCSKNKILSLPFKIFILVHFIFILFVGHYQWLVLAPLYSKIYIKNSQNDL